MPKIALIAATDSVVWIVGSNDDQTQAPALCKTSLTDLRAALKNGPPALNFTAPISGETLSGLRRCTFWRANQTPFQQGKGQQPWLTVDCSDKAAGQPEQDNGGSYLTVGQNGLVVRMRVKMPINGDGSYDQRPPLFPDDPPAGLSPGQKIPPIARAPYGVYQFRFQQQTLWNGVEPAFSDAEFRYSFGTFEPTGEKLEVRRPWPGGQEALSGPNTSHWDELARSFVQRGRNLHFDAGNKLRELDALFESVSPSLPLDAPKGPIALTTSSNNSFTTEFVFHRATLFRPVLNRDGTLLKLLPRFEAVYPLQGLTLPDNTASLAGLNVVLVQEQPENWVVDDDPTCWQPAQDAIVWQTVLDIDPVSEQDVSWLALPALRRWNEAVGDAAVSIGHLAPGPSFLPQFTGASDQSPFRWVWQLVDRYPGVPVIDSRQGFRSESLFTEPRNPAQPRRLGIPEPAIPQVAIAFPGLVDLGNVPLTGQATLRSLDFPLSSVAADKRGLRFDLVAFQPAASVYRFGAFDLALSQRQLDDTHPAISVSGAAISVSPPPIKTVDGDISARYFLTAALKATFALTDVSPGDIDLSEAEKADPDSDRPILIVARPSTGSVDSSLSRYSLIVEEGLGLVDRRTRDVTPRSLEAHLFLSLPDGAAGSTASSGAPATAPLAIVLSARPFAVAAVTPVFPSSESSTEFAAWSLTEGGRWSLKSLLHTQTILLPPQAIGEAIELKSGQIAADKPVDSRFSPAAALSFDPSRTGGDLGDLPWNLSRTFGYAAGDASGVGLRSAKFELLYGLSGRAVEPDPTRTFMRVAEIGALYGGPPKEFALDSHQLAELVISDYSDAWTSLRSALGSRLAMLRVWRPADPQPLTLSDGVGFELRPSADLLWPFTPPADPSLPPFQGNQGLAGGVGWLFESRNILKSTWRDTVSNGGEVNRLHLSALGGLGSQTALFDNRRTIITSDNHLTPGRNQRITLVRIGRIARLWNTAKHVTVFERTVAPPAQFYNIDPIGKVEDDLAGRAILRKVEDYIEITQDSRGYPDLGGSQAAAGCMVGSTFLSKRINVDSRWGFDVRDEGWAIKLWDPTFAAAGPAPGQDPQDSPAALYPKPHIALNEMGRDGSVAKREIDNPEIMLFFSSTRASDTDDTDAWLAVRDIDYDDAPAPRQPYKSTVNPTNSAYPAPNGVPAGMARGTFALVEGPSEAALAFGRSTGGVVAKIRSVTMARALPQTAPPNAILGKAADAIGAVADFARHVHEEYAALASEANAVSKDTFAHARRIQAHAQDFLPHGPVASAVNDTFNTLRTQITAQVNALALAPADVTKGIKKAIAAAQSMRLTSLPQWFDILKSGLSAASERFIPDTGDAGLILRLREDLTQAVAALQATASAAANSAVSLGGTVDSLLSHASAGLDAATILARDALLDATRQSMQRLTATLAALSDLIRKDVKTIDLLRDAFTHEMTQLLLSNPADPTLIQINGIAISAFGMIDSGGPGGGSALTATTPQLQQADGVAAVMQRIAANLKAAPAVPPGSAFDGLRSVLASFARLLLDYQICAPILLSGLANALEQGAIVAGAERDAARDALGNGVKALQSTLVKLLTGSVEQAQQQIQNDFASAASSLNANLTAIDKYIATLSPVNALAGYLDQWQNVDFGQAAVQQAVNAFAANPLSGDAQAVGTAAENLLNEMTPMVAALDQAASDAIGHITAAVGGQQTLDRAAGLFQAAASDFNLLQAFGDVPAVPGLDFSRQQVNYLFDLAGDPKIAVTQTVAMVGRQAEAAADDALREMGIRLPFSQITDRLTPDALSGVFDIASLFPDLSGLKLDSLFPGAKFPEIPDKLGDAITITHGVDASDSRAWLKAVLNTPIATKTTPVADLGPVQINLSCDRAPALLTGRAEVTVDTQGHTSTVSEATLSADWEMVIAGTSLVTFANSQLSLDRGGHLRFSLKPGDIHLAPALQFLTDLMAEWTSDLPLKLIPLDYDGEPSGVATRIDIAVPALQTGAFGIDNLNLSMEFSVSALPDFTLGVELGVGSLYSPFMINVWILAGAGFVTARADYTPAKNLAQVTSSVSISAGLGMVFDWGAIQGGGMLLFGIEADLAWQIGSGASLTLDLYLMAHGYASVLDLLSVDIKLLMEVSYQDGTAHASGVLSYSISLGPFATIDIEEGVTYALVDGGGRDDSNASDEAE